MNIRESISLAFSSLRTNKMRSFLTLLGIIVGISSVIAILTLGHALKVQSTQSIVSSGANDLAIQVNERPKEGEQSNSNDPYTQFYGGAGAVPDEDSKLDINDIQRIKDAMGDKISGVPIGNIYGGFGGELVNGERKQSVYISSVNVDFLELNKINILYGRSIMQKDIDNRRPVILISESQSQALFDSPEDAIGGELEFEGQAGATSAVVVGIYAPNTGSSGGLFGFSTEDPAYMPYTSSSALGYQEESWINLSVRPAQGEDLMQVKSQLQAVLTSMYRSNETFSAEVQDFSASADAFNQILDGISAAISAIAGISLLVGGIGVMNIMLVTVTERTREIGIRKALGATRSAIRLQFVVEAMIVCLVGGIIGVLAGGALGMLGSSFIGGVVLPPVSAILLALGFSLAIGLFFGYYPANKAAKLDPIEALRYE